MRGCQRASSNPSCQILRTQALARAPTLRGMLPLRPVRALLAFALLLLLLVGLDEAARLITPSEHGRWLLSTFITTALIGSYGWIAPVLLSWLTKKATPDQTQREVIEAALTERQRFGTQAPSSTQIIPPSPRIVVVASNTPSALSVGTGRHATVFLSRGLLGLDAGVVRFAIAHEIAHLEARHPLMQSMYFASLYAMKTLVGMPPIALALALLVYFAGLRQAEHQADRGAAAWLGAAHVEDALRRLAEALGETMRPARWVTLLSTHPSLTQRCVALAAGKKNTP